MKRKADTTTPTHMLASASNNPMSIYDPVFDVLPGEKPSKITPLRRESNRQIKKPKRDLPDETPSADSEVWKDGFWFLILSLIILSNTYLMTSGKPLMDALLVTLCCAIWEGVKLANSEYFVDLCILLVFVLIIAIHNANTESYTWLGTSPKLYGSCM